MKIRTMTDARKEPLKADRAWELLQDAEEILVGRGKKFHRFIPSSAGKGEILANCLGRTGNLRAPALTIGKRILVGFNEEMYAGYLKG